ncbi:MAG: phosphate acyltransferase PlsX [Emcibacteraceae bacterium]|nr:phosphate acyltransferase PlsX [Emcibacteraceae bacterium]
MTSELIISLDAMGGDHAPDIVIEGASIARERMPNLRFVIYGDETKIVPLLTRFPNLKSCCEVFHTDKVISADEKPSQALRRGRDSSMGKSIQAVKDGKANAAVLAGNTGAQMALAKFILRTMPGIDRPALASIIPTSRGESIMLDLGANVECDENNLVQFAIMGAAFARTVLGVSKPTVAILNVGVEGLKGSNAIQEADRMLREANIPMDYKGFTEGHGLGSGEVDVVVTDGFTGNIALKTAEGTAKMIANLLKRSLNESLVSKLGALFASSSLLALKNHLDPNNHNGAVFMGLNGLVIKSHGGASASGFASAIGVAYDMAENDLAGKITRDLTNFNSTVIDPEVEEADNEAKVIEMNIKEQK